MEADHALCCSDRLLRANSYRLSTDRRLNRAQQARRKYPPRCPARLLRRSDCKWFFFGPYSAGQSAHSPPDLSTFTIPLSTRRSSTCLNLRVFLGSNGAMHAQCSSENQKRSVMSVPRRCKTRNHASTDLGIPNLSALKGPNPNISVRCELRCR